MKIDIISEEQLEALIENGRIIRDRNGDDKDIIPVVKLNLPENPPSTWLLASVNPDNHDEAYGLCKIGNGCPELGFVSLSELNSLTGFKGKGVYQDSLYERSPYATLAGYVDTAKSFGQIVIHLDSNPNIDDL